MKIILQSVPLSKCRNRQCGDWRIYKSGTIKALAAQTGSIKTDFAVAIHEAVEALLCRHGGVSDESVTEFDAMFERERDEGKHGPNNEAGDDLRSPYYDMHQSATAVEKEVCKQFGISWENHSDNVNKILANG